MWIPTQTVTDFVTFAGAKLLLNNFTLCISKYLRTSKTRAVKLKSNTLIATFLPFWWTTRAARLELRRPFTREAPSERLAGFWRCGVSAWLCRKAESFTSQTAFDVMLTESCCREQGGDSECPCCGKNWKVFWWLSGGTCVTGILFSHLWRWMHVQTLLCMSLQRRSDRKGKKKKKKQKALHWNLEQNQKPQK